ncbi:mechanosensitive ion channel-like protein [Shimia isoporae]|uniref:Small-conductance mechanosensitive channel n=1 Tax=Shimia isoporae TaxID=647720 RepID=A0A4R1N188_9RHOB|nr:mechanosensitive ion channel domain-containing protein [Shimia isoporae]TCK99878.1 mechanosensitive ion channel-like protein [Shimia isoporae]
MTSLLKKLMAVSILMFCATLAVAQEDPPEEDVNAVDSEVYLAPVVVDGEEIFSVRGSTALPAEERADLVNTRIIEVATRNEATEVHMRIERSELGRSIYADGTLVTVTTTADADFEQMDIVVLAQLHADAVEEAILLYRANRTDEAFSYGAIAAGIWSLVFGLYCAILLWLRKRVPRLVARLVERRARALQKATADIVQSSAVSNLARFFIRLLVDITLFTGFYYYLSFVLLSFPNTRPIAELLIRYVTDPILGILAGFLSYLPNLITILIIAAITRWLIKGTRLFFESVDQGVIELHAFEEHWIWPTFNLIRGGLIVIAAVICFPYIPGSDSAAFQGLTILVGVMVSLGSNSVVSNVLAGLFVLYKRSMNVGDRIRVGDFYGDVMQIRLMETYLKSVKNELISIPNATLLSSEVINYSSKIDGKGLLLHTSVGIGYEEPRKKVEAMLIESARRTTGLKKSPAPFVLVTGLSDFATIYQINAFTTRGSSLPLMLSELHKNITDVFNENQVQIMTPNYEADTAELKISDVDWEGPLAHEATLIPDEEPKEA